MSLTKKHPAPNIVPGVNLTAKRFAEFFAWISATAADTARAIRDPFKYGLVTSFDGQSSLQLQKNGACLTLSRCCAITPAGSIIGLIEDFHPALELELQEQDLHPQEQYAVLVEVLHDTHRAFGAESPDMPLRPLYSAPAYRLHVQPLEQSLAEVSDAVQIGLLQMDFGKWKLAEYLPPCTHAGAHPLLAERQRTYLTEFEDLLDRLPKIVRNTDAYREKSMVELREFSLQLGSFAASQHFRYRHIGKQGSPFDIFSAWSGLAREMSFLLQCLKDRAGFYNLLNENTRQRNGVFFTAQSWDAAVQNLANLEYCHDNLQKAVDTLNRFLETVTPVIISLTYGVEEVKSRTHFADEKRKNSYTW